MPFVIHSGRAGSGKSYNVVQNVILKSLKDGRSVVTNIPLITEELEADETITGSLFTFDIDNLEPDFFSLEKVYKGAVYVFDEAQKLWPSGMAVDRFPQDQKRFLSEHRHLVSEENRAVEIIVISQDASLLAKYIRTLADYTFIYKKLSAVGQSKSFNTHIYEGSVCADEQGGKTPVNSYVSTYKKEVFKYYKSHALSDSKILGADETATDKRTTVFSSPFFKYLVPLGVVALIGSLYLLSSRFDEVTEKKPIDDYKNPALMVPADLDTRDTEKQLKAPSKDLFLTDFEPLYRIAAYSKNYVLLTDDKSYLKIPFERCEFYNENFICEYANRLFSFKPSLISQDDTGGQFPTLH